MTRRPRGFRHWPVHAGVIFVREDAAGGWVVLAADPMVKMDNRHRDGRPHIHVGGWESDATRDLRPGLTAEDAAEAVARHLNAWGHIVPARLVEELK